jgi:elongation factor Ts
MADYTPKDVQRLRQETGLGMMDAKKALDATHGDFEAAKKRLREMGMVKSTERSGRANEQGAVATARTDRTAAIVELRSETDFVAKSPDFTSLVNEMAQAVAEQGESAVDEFKDQLDTLRITLKENVDLGRVVRFEAPPDAVLDTYVHVQSERGVNGVLVELTGGDRALAHEVSLHIAHARPQWRTRDEVPAERVEDERDVLEKLTRNEGKPEQAIPKIVEGRLNGFFRDNVLLEQPFVKDTKQSVQQFLGDAQVTRFAQVEIGRA